MHFLWKIENFDELQLRKTLIIFLEILHTFPAYQCLQKGAWDFFLFCLEFQLFAKIKKDLVSTHSQKLGLSITQDLNNIKKIPHRLL